MRFHGLFLVLSRKTPGSYANTNRLERTKSKGLRPNEELRDAGDLIRSKGFLGIGLPTDQLRASMCACLTGDGNFAELQLPAINRRGNTMT